MKIKVAVIMCIYNTKAVAMQAIVPMVEHACEGRTSFFLVDNKGPENAEIKESVRQNWNSWKHPVRWLEPGKNLGCHDGWNYGYEEARKEGVRSGEPFTHYVKIDDDTIVQTNDWTNIMAKALDALPDFAYLVADGDCRRKYEYIPHEENGAKVAMPHRDLGHGRYTSVADLSFSLVMFKASTIETFGFMHNARYMSAEGKTLSDTSLYGGEEVYYGQLANKHSLVCGMLPSVYWHHLGNEERHPDYPMWKWTYGYRGWTTLPMDAWILDKGETGALWSYRKRLGMELKEVPVNDCSVRDIVKRLGALGEQMDVKPLTWLSENTKNGVVKETCVEAIKAIESRKV
jgi:hypothetical protein